MDAEHPYDEFSARLMSAAEINVQSNRAFMSGLKLGLLMALVIVVVVFVLMAYTQS